MTESNMLDNNSAEQEAEKIDVKTLICPEISIDAMTAYVRLIKPDNPDNQEIVFTKEDIIEVINREGIIFGINEDSIDKLAKRPIFNLKIKIGEGVPPQNGKNGFVDYFVVKDSEYSPEISQDEDVDFKNLDYFQIVKEGQLLCAIIPPENGVNGTDVKGREVLASDGKPAMSPQGKNTSFNESGDLLYSDCDGIVNFTTDIININDALVIKSDVNMNTGNIDFSGDVIIEGNVCEGFSVKSGKNIIIKGLVESASIEAAGDVQIGRGINGDLSNQVIIGGDFRCPYIEHTTLSVSGNIISETIIESNITCSGDVDLSKSKKGMIVGGTCNISGNLIAKTVGNEKERVTVIKFEGQETGNHEEAKQCKKRREDLNKIIDKLKNERRRFVNPIKNEENPFASQLKLIDLKLSQCQTEIEELTNKISELEEKWSIEYQGSLVCKNKMYYGTRVFFGDKRFVFDSDTVEHCRIYWSDGEIISGII